MTEAAGASIPAPPVPQGTNPWIIVIAAIVILCCFCVGLIGLLFAFGGPILNELGVLHALLPTLTL